MSSVYVIAPSLTLRRSEAAEAFLGVFHRELSKFCAVSLLSSVAALLRCEPRTGDVVVFFNRPDQDYLDKVLRFLEQAEKSGIQILPVAISKAERHPPKIVERSQSFDVVEGLRQRALDDRQVDVLATVFARQVLSILTPTLVKEPMHLFLSHRRLDGEEITSSFHQTLLVTAQKGFRDLFDVRVGEDAQEVIIQRLRESDAVIFLDTPKTGESSWVAKELEAALGLQLPIVWVRIGPDANRVPLRVTPSGVPHFVYPEIDASEGNFTGAEVDRIVQLAFEIHHRDFVNRLLDEFGRLKDIDGKNGVELRNVDPRRMIYSLKLPRKAGRYRERPLTHLLQLFGHTPTREDVHRFLDCAKEIGFEAHPVHGHHYDSAILLAAIPSRPTVLTHDSGIHTDSIGDYVSTVEEAAVPRLQKRKRLILSGAFADCEPAFQQSMTSAVHAVAEAALRAGVKLIFGAHPTFQFLIFDLSKRLIPNPRDHVRMYISRYFVTDAGIAELQNSAEVIATDVTGDRATSLTTMRKAMFTDTEGAALVVIGGKTAAGGHTPGVDEEIDLARKAGLPVFIFGSVGGRSSELMARMSPVERAALNALSEEANEAFATSLDYAQLAKLVMDAAFPGT